jgi:hypothetical protein
VVIDSIPRLTPTAPDRRRGKGWGGVEGLRDDRTRPANSSQGHPGKTGLLAGRRRTRRYTITPRRAAAWSKLRMGKGRVGSRSVTFFFAIQILLVIPRICSSRRFSEAPIGAMPPNGLRSGIRPVPALLALHADASLDTHIPSWRIEPMPRRTAGGTDDADARRRPLRTSSGAAHVGGGDQFPPAASKAVRAKNDLVTDIADLAAASSSMVTCVS